MIKKIKKYVNKVNESVYIIKVFLQSRYLNYIMNLSNGSIVAENNDSRVKLRKVMIGY